MDAVDRAVESLGIKELKAEQRKVIDAFIWGRDVFVYLPTGFGKSVCYMVLPLVFDIIRNAVSGKSSTGSKHSLWKLLSSFAYFKSCAVHMTRNVCLFSSFEDLSLLNVSQDSEDLSSFFEIKQRLKCKTYRIDKEKTSIMILKSFSYKVRSNYWHVNLYNYYNIIYKLTYQYIQFYNFICFVHIK